MSDVNLRQAAEACGNLAKMFRGVLALSDAIGKVADLESHLDALMRQRDAAQAELDGVLASLATAKAVHELEAAEDAVTARLATMKAELASEQTLLDTVRRKQATAQTKVKELEVEAAATEKRLATMRADVDAMKARFGS